MSWTGLGAVPLFVGLSERQLEGVRRAMTARRFQAGEALCVEGEPGSTLFVLTSGLAQVSLGGGEAAEVVARLRRGDVVGEMSMLTGEPRSASVIALIPTEALELHRAAFSELLAREPLLLDNLVHLLRDRLVSSNRRARGARRQAALLVVGAGQDARADEVISDAQAARPAPLTVGDRRKRTSISALLDAAEAGDVLAVLGVEDPALPVVLDHVDRAALLASPAETEKLRSELGARASRLRAEGVGSSLGRYLGRTRLGLALGAGGARGYAHVGALHALERAGYALDAVAGSSIGGVVGAAVAMGMDAATVEATMRRVFTPEAVAALFRLSLGPRSPAMDLWVRVLREMTEDRDFSDLALPLVVMTADLDSRSPAPLTEGPVWEALVATTALPGMAPPLRRGAARLVDGLALVPVPTLALEPHADVTISVNLMNREQIPCWPGEEAPPQAQAAGYNALDTLLEALELTHIDASTRCAALADWTITPRFGPSTWKDFHRADAFLRAGREAALAGLPTLGALLRPAGGRA